MSLVPKWFHRFPKPNLSKFFEDIEDELSPLISRSTGLSVSSDDHNIYIEAHVPGLCANDIEVSIDEDGVLWIKGEKKVEENDKKKKFYRRSQSQFSYCVPIVEEVDFEQEPKATCKDGIMRVTFARRKERQSEVKKIRVEEEK